MRELESVKIWVLDITNQVIITLIVGIIVSIWFMPLTTNQLIIVMVGLIVGPMIMIRQKLIKEKPNFSKSFNKVEPEIRKLENKIKSKKFEPDIILGITSETLIGGCIVGAWLASPPFINKSKGFYPAFRDKELSKALKKFITKDSDKNILLVDDESQSGDTIRKEFEELQKCF